MVDTEEKLIEVITKLEQKTLLGVDFENHHLKSYNGYLCLIQLTTPEYETYLIDVIKLGDALVQSEQEMPSKGYLSRLFSNPQILKVFHGCLHSDVAWL